MLVLTIAVGILFVFEIVLIFFFCLCIKMMGEEHNRYLNFRDYCMKRFSSNADEIRMIWTAINGTPKDGEFYDEKPPDL